MPKRVYNWRRNGVSVASWGLKLNLNSIVDKFENKEHAYSILKDIVTVSQGDVASFLNEKGSKFIEEYYLTKGENNAA